MRNARRRYLARLGDRLGQRHGPGLVHRNGKIAIPGDNPKRRRPAKRRRNPLKLRP